MVILLVIGGYLWPYKPCGRCDGRGRNIGSSRRSYGDCGRCNGSGRKYRLGARAVNRAAQAISKRLRGGMRR
jgi:hypothetical protein